MMNTAYRPSTTSGPSGLDVLDRSRGYAALITQGTSPLADSMFHPDLIWNNPDVVQEGNHARTGWSAG